MRRLLLVLVALLLAACGAPAGEDAEQDAAPAGEDAAPAGEDPATSAEEPPGTAPDGPAPAAPLPAGLDVTLPAVGGGDVAFGEHAGQHLALWFWAPW